MIPQSNFSLLHELYENIAIFDDNLNLIYQGYALSEILTTLNINLKLSSGDEHSLKLLKDKFQQCSNSPDPVDFKFRNSLDQFIIIPAKDGTYLFGLKNKITRINKIENDLKERVKELECIYNLTEELEAAQDKEQMFVNCTKIIHDSFQYPADTIVNLEIGKKIFGDTNWTSEEISNFYSADINLNSRKIGEIKIYLKNKADLLEEEQRLINDVAKTISREIEKEERTKNLEKQGKILTAKNEALIKLTEECYQKREKLRTFFRAITDKIIVIDRDFEIIMSNKDDIGESGKCYEKLFNLKACCKDCSALTTFNSAQDAHSEKEFSGKNYLLRTYPILSMDGQLERVLEVCRDVTKQKKMEAQLMQSYKLASLGKLVAGVAHEINNPNTFILGNLKIVQESFDDIFPILEKYYEANKDLKIARLKYDIFKENISILVNDMINGANRTKKIVGDLRNFAKKDDGALTEDVDLNDLIKNNMTITQKHVKKFAQLEINLQDNIPTFKGNLNKMEQVLLNLMMNASEAMEGKEGLIKIETCYDNDAQEIILIVSDNGCGMDEATVKNIFDPFFTTKRDKGGTGLGLSISYGIIKELNGKIEVDSKVGAGTTFRIRIPAKRGI